MLGIFKRRVEKNVVQAQAQALVQARARDSSIQQALAEKIALYEYRQGRILEDDLDDNQTAINFNGRIKLVKKLQVPRSLS